jgi:ribosome biogenesis GTPase
MEGFERFLAAGQTVVLLGSSGVGKSSIANRLLGETQQEVRPVREGDSRGRHTTAARELFVLPGGALLIDTPGLRELQPWDEADGVSQAFADIDALAAECRFSDCTHESEPGCAVRAALSAGIVEEARLENRRKLLREQEFLRRKSHPAARREEKERIKRLYRGIRQVYRHKNSDSQAG